ncbi:MAG: hypothetical protein ACPHID_02370 [Thermoplasmatota archaeon]
MNQKAMIASVALLLVSMSLPVQGYHIVYGSGTDYRDGRPVSDWGQGNGLLILCESHDFLGADATYKALGDDVFDLTGVVLPPGPGPIENHGDGGLCFMSAGGDLGSATRQVIPSDGDAPTPGTLHNYLKFDMCAYAGAACSIDVEWTAQVGTAQCDDLLTTEAFFVDEQYALWVDEGHVAGFPTTTADFGSYTVAAPNAVTEVPLLTAGTVCDPTDPYAPVWVL